MFTRRGQAHAEALASCPAPTAECASGDRQVTLWLIASTGAVVVTSGSTQHVH